MKLKLFTGITLAVLTAVVLWLWFNHRPKPQEKSVSALTKSDIVSLPKPAPANGPKMVTVTSGPADILSPTLSPAISDWPVIQKIVDPRADYKERLNAISSLSNHLTEVDWGELQLFLLKPDPMDKDQLGQVIKNQLLDVLCALNPPPNGLGDVLTKMYQDHQQDDVIRDYAVQHLAAYYEQITTQHNSAKIQQAVQNVLWEAVNETSDSIGGTALLALKRLSQEYAGFDQKRMAATALRMAGDYNAGELSHITAFQVCAQLGTTDALPVVLQAAQNGETVSVRISAVGALGSLGGADQIPFLNQLLQSGEERLQPAAHRALTQITLQQK
jgi:hypothetical protein